jgi:hypothetical protein
LLLPGAGLLWPGWSAGAANAAPVIRASADAARRNVLFMEPLLQVGFSLLQSKRPAEREVAILRYCSIPIA